MTVQDKALTLRRGAIGVAQWTFFLALFALLVLACRRGFDLTDESYYVFWTYFPSNFQASIHPFGLLLNLAAQILGGSIVALRVFGVVLLSVCGVAVGHGVDRYYRRVVGHRLAFEPRALAAIFALANYAAISILTPSYNLLANAAGCLLLAGALGWAVADHEARSRRADLVPSLLVGLGGMLAFFGKPTFAALAAAAIAVQIGICWRRRGSYVALRRIAVTAVVCIAPLAAVIAATIGFERFLGTFGAGLATLHFGNDLGALPLKTVKDLVRAPLPLVLTCIAFAAAVAWSSRGRRWLSPRWVVGAAFGVLLLDLAYLGALLVRMVVRDAGAFEVLAAPVLCGVVGMLTVGVVRGRAAAATMRIWWPVAVLLALPFATAFGTANPLVSQTGASLYATLLGAAIAADLLLARPLAIGMQTAFAGFTALLLLWASHTPYGLPEPLSAQTRPLRVLPQVGVVYVDPMTFTYVGGLRALAQREKLAATTPIVDLSGGGPGTALMLNGNAPYYPWIVHIFGKGSADLADTVWYSLTSRQKREAWVVLPADSAFSNTEVLKDVMRNRGCYRLGARLPMVFWKQQRQIEVWIPRPSCTRPTTASARHGSAV